MTKDRQIQRMFLTLLLFGGACAPPMVDQNKDETNVAADTLLDGQPGDSCLVSYQCSQGQALYCDPDGTCEPKPCATNDDCRGYAVETCGSDATCTPYPGFTATYDLLFPPGNPPDVSAPYSTWWGNPYDAAGTVQSFTGYLACGRALVGSPTEAALAHDPAAAARARLGICRLQ